MVTMNAKTIAKQNNFVRGCSTYFRATAFRSADPTKEDYETPDDFAEDFEASTRKSKATEADKTKKKNRQSMTARGYCC